MTMNSLNEKFCRIFDNIENEFDELSSLVSAVEIMSDHKLYAHYLKRLKSIEEIAKKYKQYKLIERDVLASEELIESEGLEGLQSEIDNLKNQRDIIVNELKALYAEGQAKQEECVEIEISSKDDDEFLELLKDIFSKFAEQKAFELCEEDASGDSVKLKISGEGVYNSLRFFSGKVKKILRGVESFANIVVLKTENYELEIREEDLIIQTSKSGGAGGQHINKTESAVKIIHEPTGLFAECQDERSQAKNKEKALIALQKKIENQMRKNYEKNISSQRKEIRNKLFASTPELIFDFDANKLMVNNNRTEYKLKEILNGNLDLIINNQV